MNICSRTVPPAARRAAVTLALLALVAAPAPARAQHGFPLAVEARGGLTHPVPCMIACENGSPDAGDAGLREIDAELALQRWVSLYGAYAGYRLREDVTHPPDRGWGYGFGLRLRLAPSHPTPVEGWVRVGMVRHRRTALARGLLPDSVEATSDWAWGHEYGAGLLVRALPMLSLTPGIRLQSYRALFGTGAGTPLPFEMMLRTNYFVVDLGVRLGR